MPRDKVARDSAGDKPRISFEALRGAGLSPKEEAARDKAVAKQERLNAILNDKDAGPNAKRAAQKELNRDKKQIRDKEAKETRRNIADQFGLGRDSQKEGKGAKAAETQQKNFESIQARVAATPRGQGRAELRALRKTIKEGPVVGTDPKTGKNIRDPKQTAKYLGGADNVAKLSALVDQKIGKSYSGSKEKKGVFNVTKDAFSGKKTAEYVKQRAGVTQNSPRTKAPNVANFPKRGRGRPKGSGKKSGESPPKAQ
jgi:hypothetical protein